MKPQTIHLTQEGYHEISQELQDLKTTKHPQAVERVQNAREHGDLSENSEYHAARADLQLIEGRVEELEELLSRAKIVAKSSNGSVGLGNQVTVISSGKQTTFHIVGKYEADPTNKKISDESPLGQALLGKKVGDKVEYLAPVGKILYTIDKIH